MFTRATALTPPELKPAIVRDPLVISPDAKVIDAVAQMSGVRSSCDAAKAANGGLESLHQEARSSCVLVVKDERVVGILTERDVVRLSSQQEPLDCLALSQVMVSPVVTLRESDFTDLFYVINLFQRLHIRHLPILDQQDHLIGLVTHESLRQISQPIDLLRVRWVSEVMTREVICATPDCPMWKIAQRMAVHRVSSVVIVKGGSQKAAVKTQTLQVNDQKASLPSSDSQTMTTPMGIITERDLVQFQSLGLSLKHYRTHLRSLRRGCKPL